jgi:nicotinamidase-related amidase
VVDVQNGFVTPESQLAVPVIAQLVADWASAGGSVVFSRYVNYSGSEFERLMNWRGLYGPPDTDLVPDLKPNGPGGSVIDKRTYSGVTPEFLRLVHRNRWTDVVVCGIDTELCVLATVFDVFDNGLTPWVVTDASASTGGQAFHEAGLLVMARGIGDQQLLSARSVLDMAATRHP